MVSTLEIEIDARIARVTINRPDKRNAIDDATRAKLADAFARLDGDDEVRVIILTGAGSAFCAGVDLGAGAQIDNPVNIRARLSEPLDKCGKPVLAAINGPAFGGGLELALACDLRIASTTASFGLPEVRLGSLAGSGGTQRLAGSVGRALAAQMLFTGEPITAERALQAGLVSELCAPAALSVRAQAIAAVIAQNAPLSLSAVKRALRAATDGPLAAGFELERALYGALAVTADRKEGRQAFRERRKPNFQGR